jgi:hypothetical protein
LSAEHIFLISDLAPKLARALVKSYGKMPWIVSRPKHPPVLILTGQDFIIGRIPQQNCTHAVGVGHPSPALCLNGDDCEFASAWLGIYIVSPTAPSTFHFIEDTSVSRTHATIRAAVAYDRSDPRALPALTVGCSRPGSLLVSNTYIRMLQEVGFERSVRTSILVLSTHHQSAIVFHRL